MRARRGSTTVALAGLLLSALASCLDDSSPRLACDDLRTSFVAKSESLGCGFGGASYTCTAWGSGNMCSSSEIDACQGAIDGATDCRSLSGGGNCVLHCE